MTFESRVLRILHFSDFHSESPLSAFQSRIVDELVSDLCREVSAGALFDFAVFTGDLTRTGSEDEFRCAEENLLRPVLAAAELLPQDIFFVPGNHDIYWDDIDPDAEHGLADVLQDNTDAVDDLLTDDRRLKRATARVGNFWQFERDWYEHATDENGPDPSPPLARSKEKEFGSSKIGIGLINSSWRSTSGNDKAELLIGERQIAACLEGIASSTFRIVAFHHPIDWLQDHDSRSTQNWLQRRAHLVLTGHTHMAEPEFRMTPGGSTTYSGAGCLYESSEYANAYSIITVTLNEASYSVDLDVHPYSPASGFTRIESATQFQGLSLQNIPYVADSTVLAEALPTPANMGRHLAVLAERHSVIPQHIAKRRPSRVREIFVDPIFLPMPFAQLAKELGGKEYKEHHLDARELLRQKSCLAICGDHESGLTGSLLWTLDHFPATDMQAIPVYLESRDLISGPPLIDRAVRHALLDFDVTIGRTDPLPRLVIAIDNAERLKVRQLEHIVSWHQQHPEHLIVFGWHDERLSASEQLRRLGADHNVCHLGPLGIPELRTIVQKLTPDAASETVETVLKILRAENLPRTPYVMTLLAILVAESAAQFEGLSQSTLLDKYVTHLLEMAAGGQSSRVGFDPENWSRILEHVAEQFRTGGLRFRSRLEVDGFVMDYFRSLKWGDTVLPIVEQLLEWRILVQHGDLVGFWHPALLDIFLGRRINTEFRTASAEVQNSYTELALSDPLLHSRPIEHAAALAKGNRVILERIAQFDERTFLDRGPKLESADLLAITPRSTTSGPRDLEALAKQVQVHVPSPEERENLQIEEWQRFEASHAEDAPPEDFGDDDELGLIDELLATVRLFSSVLRSSEHLADADLKRALLRRAVEQWAGVAVLILLEESFNEISTEIVKQNIVKGDLSEDDRIAFIDRIVHLFLVVFISVDMNEALGTRKMNELLDELLEDGEFFGNPAYALFGTLLFSELEAEIGSRWLDFMERVLKDHKKYQLVLDTLMVSLQRRFYYGPIREQDRDRLAALLADVVLEMNGVRNERRRARAKAELVAQLNLDHQTQKASIARR